MAINAYEISAVHPSPAQQCVLPTFLIASRKNRRNLFTSFLHNIQTSGAARSGWRSWGTANPSRTIRQAGSCSREGISQPWGPAPSQPRHPQPPWAPLLCLLCLTSPSLLLSSSRPCWECLGSVISEGFSLNSCLTCWLPWAVGAWSPPWVGFPKAGLAPSGILVKFCVGDCSAGCFQSPSVWQIPFAKWAVCLISL